jgi:tetratricopeptide (TPR) repeat protein
VSQLATNYDRASDTYRTTWAEPGINCETCHGPGAEHVRTFTAAPKDAAPKELGLIRTKTMTHEQRSDMCASCHARIVPLTATFRPGDRFFDHFDLGALESGEFYPDGRDLGENYTFTTWRLSRCAQSGQLDCVTCHTSSGRYRFRADEDANAACSPCHAEKVRAPRRHTHHRDGSAASRCVSCHMPRTEFARMVRSDHSMRAPSPAATLAFGSPNACNLCHADRDARWADGEVRRWHRRDYQAPVLAQGGLVKAAREGEWSRLPAMLAYVRAGGRQEIVAAGLARLLRRASDARVAPALAELVRRDPSPLVRAAAAESLGALGAPGAVAALAAATRDPYRLVRVRAARGLASVAADQLPEGLREAVAAATRELEAALTVRADDPWALTNLGTWELERGHLDRAESAFRDALRVRPAHVPAWVNLSMAQARRGDAAAAETSLRNALAVDPESAAANLDLGLLLAESRRPAEAESALRRALTADPTLAQAEYNLCALLAEERLAEAVSHCRRAASLRPGSGKYAYAYAFFAWRSGDDRAAISTLESMLRQKPGDADPYLLLASIHEKAGRRLKAAEVLRRASADPGIPAQTRRTIEERSAAAGPR